MKTLLLAGAVGDLVSKTVTTTTADQRLVLEYLRILGSFPVVTLVIFLVISLLYKEEVKSLFHRMRTVKAMGGEAVFDAAAIEKNVTDTVTEALIEPKRKEVEALPNGPEKDAQVIALEGEIQQLRRRIADAFDVAATRNKLGGLNNSGSHDDMRLAVVARELEFLRVKYACKDLVEAWIVRNKVTTTPNRGAVNNTFGLHELFKQCAEREPQLAADYEKTFNQLLVEVIASLAPIK